MSTLEALKTSWYLQVHTNSPGGSWLQVQLESELRPHHMDNTVLPIEIPEASAERLQQGSIPYLFSGALSEILNDDKRSLDLAAIVLLFMEEELKTAGIEPRPESIATLFDIGYDHARPTNGLRANKFGRRVAEFMQSEACRRMFGRIEEAADDR